MSPFRSLFRLTSAWRVLLRMAFQRLHDTGNVIRLEGHDTDTVEFERFVFRNTAQGERLQLARINSLILGEGTENTFATAVTEPPVMLRRTCS